MTMATVHLLSAAGGSPQSDPYASLTLDQMRAAARKDRFAEHFVIDDPARADLILFVETSLAAGHYYERVRNHPLYREFRAKSYLISSIDKAIPFIPGVFASIEARWYWPRWTRSGSYLGVVECDTLCYQPSSSPSLLFSFIGSAQTAPVRRRIVTLRHPEAELIDTDAEALTGNRDKGPLRAGLERLKVFPRTHPTPALPQDQYRDRYARSIRDSAFVLCLEAAARHHSDCSRP